MNGIRVLVIDDSALMAEVIKDLLLEAGAIVIDIRRSAAGALHSLATQAVDLACVDVDLGDETSFSVADDLTARRIPFVFVTGSGREVLPQRHWQRPLVCKMEIETELIVACRAAVGSASVALRVETMKRDLPLRYI